MLLMKQGNHRELEVEAEHVSGMSQGLWHSGLTSAPGGASPVVCRESCVGWK